MNEPGEDRVEIVLYADGSCRGNPGPGGWGVILLDVRSGRRLEASGGDPETTNNRMELTAVLEGLRLLKRPARVRIVTDSRYVADGLSSWVHGWKRNGWRTADRKPVKNKELWEELLRQVEEHVVEFQWIKGHAGHPENERCDELAVTAATKLLGN